MGPEGQKSIFGQKIESSNFSTKICLKILPRGLKSIFGREIHISIFRPNMDLGGQKSTFGHKIENSVFWSKFAGKCA